MLTLGAYEKCRRYIECHSKHTDEFNRYLKLKGYFPTVTISRQTGAGATMVGEKFIKIMSNQFASTKCEWAYFDKNLIEKVLADYNLPEMFSNLKFEDKYSNVETLIKDFFWFNESNWSLVQKTSKTIIKLAEMGNVIIVGRGANIITSKLKNVIHIRLVAPLNTRIQHIQEYFNMSIKEAREYIRREEQARKNYLKSYFYKEIENPVHYHLILNTQLLGYEGSAKLIAEAVMEKFPKIYAEEAN
ncbi:MAG TPA: cytidylate kinase-like family protein [Ignavibacteriaceae bacterium]|nr:cytidylate kinase-like family protein [Ignavibacteriaceae bacterium]